LQHRKRPKNVSSDAYGNPCGEGIYLILDRQGKFKVGDVVIPVAKDDVVIVPQNAEYEYQGQLQLSRTPIRL
jgi:hypothetical protein